MGSCLALIRTGLNPNCPVYIHVGLTNTIEDNYSHYIIIINFYIFRLRINWWFDMLGSSVRNKLIQTINIIFTETGECTVIIHANKNRTPAGVAECNHFLSQ